MHFILFNSDGTYIRFGLCKNTNLYTLDIGMTKPELSLSHTTVEDEKGKYSAIDIRRAKKVRHLQKVLGSPSDKDLANVVDNNIFATSLTRRDIRIAKNIFGPNVVALKGKTTKRKSKMPNSEDIEDLSSYIIEVLKDC